MTIKVDGHKGRRRDKDDEIFLEKVEMKMVEMKMAENDNKSGDKGKRRDKDDGIF